MSTPSPAAGDLLWFRSHANHNRRLRAPFPGEVAEVGDLPFDAPPPAPGVEWQILAIRLPRGHVARLLVIVDPAAPSVVTPAVLGERVAVA